MDKTLMKKATADTPEPTPGYVFRDVIAMTFTDIKTQDQMVKFLLDKIRDPSLSSSTHVLTKTLRVIKHLCEKGHPDCQKEFQRHSDTIKVCAAFRGKPDATYGDMLNQQVRDAAREAMEAAFNPRKEAKTLDVTSQAGKAEDDGKRTSGFTTGNIVAGAGGSNQGVLASATDQVKEAVKTGFGLWKEKPKSANEKMLEDMYNQQHQQGQYVTPTIPVDSVPTVPIPAGSFGAPTTDASWKTLSQSGATTAQPTVKVLTPAQRAVERITTLKSTPQRVELSTFHQACAQAVEAGETSWDDIAVALDENLIASCNWQVRLNAICGIEVLAKAGISDVVQYFTENPEELQRNVNVVQATLKERATKVLTAMNLPVQAQEKKAPTQASVFATNGGKAEMSWSPSLNTMGGGAGGAVEDSTGTGLFSSGDGGMKVRDRQKDKTTKLKKRTPGAGMQSWDDSQQEGGAATTTTFQTAPPPTTQSTPAVVPASRQYDVLDDLFGTAPPPPAQPVVAPVGTSQQKAFSFM